MATLDSDGGLECHGGLGGGGGYVFMLHMTPPPKNVVRGIYKYVDCKKGPNFFKLKYQLGNR